MSLSRSLCASPVELAEEGGGKELNHIIGRQESLVVYNRSILSGMGNYVCHAAGQNRGGIFKLLWSQEIDSKESIPSAYVARARIFKKSMGARHRVGIGLLYRPARLHRLAEFIPWNRLLGSINV